MTHILNTFFHVLGHPDLPLSPEAHPENAQIRTCFSFCELLAYLKVSYNYYGIGECQPLPGNGTYISLGKPRGRWQWQNSWHFLYTRRLSAALAKCQCTDVQQVACSLYGAAHSQVDLQKMLVCEPMVGYNHCWAPSRVFPSRAQQNVIYSTCGELTQATCQNDAVIPHFLNQEEYPLGNGGGGYLLYLGRNVPGKGIERARQCAADTGIPLRVEHSGWYGVAKWRLLAEAQAVLCPTLYPEPFGYVAAEAMMCGTPVIASDWGAFPEIIQQGKTGYLCRTREEFAAAALKVSSLPRPAIREYAVRHFSLEAVAPQYLEYFCRLFSMPVNENVYAGEEKS